MLAINDDVIVVGKTFRGRSGVIVKTAPQILVRLVGVVDLQSFRSEELHGLEKTHHITAGG